MAISSRSLVRSPTGATLSRRGGCIRLQQHDVGRSDTFADGRPVDGAAGPRRNRRRRSTGAVSAMRSKMLRVTAPQDAVDIVGTGGDGSGLGQRLDLRVVHRGGRRRPRRQARPTARCRRVRGLPTCWLHSGQDRPQPRTGWPLREGGRHRLHVAPSHHPAMKNVGPTRVELATRTIFNLLGPLSNPAGVKRQMVGVFLQQWCSLWLRC